MEINFDEKEEKIKHLFQRDLKKEEINNNNEKNIFKTNTSRSNQNLVNIKLDKKSSMSILSEKESKIKKRKQGKALSIKIPKILLNSNPNRNNDILESMNSNSNNLDIDYLKVLKIIINY